MIFSDLHMHTNYCDGKDSPEEMVISAIEKGLKRVGILAHSYVFYDESCSISPIKEDDFVKEVNQLKLKYKDKIEVLCGIEQDLYSTSLTDKYDYVIGSMHYFKFNNEYQPLDYTEEKLDSVVKQYFNGDYYLAVEEYYKELESLIEKTNADIIGHFDLITKFNEKNKHFDVKNDRYVKAWQKAVDKLLTYNKPFEINTGGISRGLKKQPYPSLQIIEYIKDKGGKFVLSSDAHKKENVAFEFNKYYKLFK